MKLTLLNKCGVFLRYSENEQQDMRWWSSSFWNNTPSDFLNELDKHFMEKRLVWSVITDSDNMGLTVFLISKDGSVGKYLQIQSMDETDGNIFKKLRKTFGDQVKLLVRIEASPHLEDTAESRYICLQELTIGEGKKDFYVTDKNSEFNPGETCVYITVHVVISDDHEVIRQAKEKIAVPRMTTRKILQEGLDSNLVIIAQNGAETKSHKNFLIASSAVLNRMFANELEESKTGIVDMTDLSEEGVKAFLHFIYCGDKIEHNADINLAFELLYASHKYEVFQLEEFMITYWKEINKDRIDINVALKTYMFVRGIETASQVKAKILHKKYDELKALSEYKDLCKTPMVLMELCEDLVNVSKVDTE